MANDSELSTKAQRTVVLDDVKAKYLVGAGLLGGALLASLAATVYMGNGAVPGLTALSPLVHYGLPVVRVLLDVSTVATVGLSVLPKLLGFDRPSRTEPVMELARRATVATALIWMASALLSLVLQAAELQPGGTVTTTTITRYIAEVPAGSGLLLSGTAGLACALLGLFAVRHGESVPAELRILVAVLGLLPMPLTGHGTNWVFHDFTMISMELHVVAAALWTGGLGAVALFVAPRRGLLATVLPRFSKLAGVAICTVGISGLFNGTMELVLTPGAGIGGLISTQYGHIILLKVTLLVALAVLGAHARYRLLPLVERHQRTALISWLALEISVMGLAYGLGAVLARSPVVS